jgi:hypothetical protein
MAIYVDDLNLRCWDASEVEEAGQPQTLSGKELMGARRDIKLDAAERLAGEARSDSYAPSDESCPVRAENLRWAGSELETVPITVDTERCDYLLLDLVRILDLSSQPEIDVLREPCIVAEANLQCHTSFEHPPTRIGGLKPSDDALEKHSPPKPVKRDAGGGRSVAESVLKGSTKGVRCGVGHGATTAEMARSM